MPGLAPAEVRALLGAPLTIARRVPLIGESGGRGPFSHSDPLPPIAPGGDDWSYTHTRTTEYDDGYSITKVADIKVSFGADGKVVDCRFVEYDSGEGTQLLNSVNPYDEQHCTELRD